MAQTLERAIVSLREELLDESAKTHDKCINASLQLATLRAHVDAADALIEETKHERQVARCHVGRGMR
jgi:hypothetical protein